MKSFDHVNTKVDALTQKIDNLTITTATTVAAVTPNFEISRVQGHVTVDYQLLSEPTPDLVNHAQGNPYSNTYTHGWRNHPNFSYKNNNALFAPNLAPFTHLASKTIKYPVLLLLHPKSLIWS